MTVTTKPQKVRYRAGADGVAHGHVTGRPRTLCDQPPVAERDAWPPLRNCSVCEKVDAQINGRLL